jgi:hypothetical protein
MKTRKPFWLKLSALAAVVLIATVGFFGFLGNNFQKVKASASGPSPSFTNAPGETNCTQCHTGTANSGAGTITISGIPANYKPGQQIPVTVTVSQMAAVIFGFQLTAIDNQGSQAGTFSLPTQTPPQMQIVPGIVGGNQRRYVQHTSDGVTPTQFDTKSWTFNWTAPAARIGRISFYAAGNAANSDGSPAGDSIYTTDRQSFAGTLISNFDNDTKSDAAVFRPSNGTWYTLNSSNGNFQAAQFGVNGDKPVAGDYDGDGKTDFAVFRPSNGTWYLLRSTAGFTGVQFGVGGDAPVSGDFDGDAKTDIAVFRPSTGAWYILNSSNGGFTGVQFGAGGDKTAQGDYDADGKTDIAVFRPSTGTWFALRSSNGQFVATQFGANGDKPVQGDYDGDGRTDVAVFRPSNGSWYLLRSTAGFTGVQFGITTDTPAPADFDGDGSTDIAVFRSGAWYILGSTSGFTGFNFGTTGDIPVPAGGYIAE